MGRIKILYIISSLRRCGPTTVLCNIVNSLARELFEAAIMTLSPEGNDSLASTIQSAGFKIYFGNSGRLRWIYSELRHILDVIAQFQPDIIHSHGVRPDIVNALAGNRAITFSTIHNALSGVYKQKYGKLTGTMMDLLHLAAIKRIHYPVACAKGLAADLKTGYGVEAAAVPNGIDLAVFNGVADKTKKELRAELNLPDASPVFVTSGGLTAWKNPFSIIKAFTASAIGRKAVLVICGDGPLRAACQKQANGNPRICFRGNVTNIKSYLMAADYFISASRIEGLPNSVLEAMACCLPVILSDIPAHREILDYDYRAGILFAHDHPEGLIKTLDNVDIIASDAGIYARKVIEKHFSKEVMARKYAALYEMACFQSDRGKGYASTHNDYC